MASHESAECAQAVPIATLQANLVNISELVHEMRTEQKQVLVVLEKLAVQNSRIEHLEENIVKTGKSLGEAFNRIRTMENRTGEGKIIMATVACSLLGQVVLKVLFK
jgi:hypothetical protein